MPRRGPSRGSGLSGRFRDPAEEQDRLQEIVSGGGLRNPRRLQEQVNELQNEVRQLEEQVQSLKNERNQLREQVNNSYTESEVQAFVEQANAKIQEAYQAGQQSVIDYLREQGFLQ